MRLTLDLHLHSQASPDGRMTVEEIAAAARARGLHGVAVCDHDVVYTGPTEVDGVLLLLNTVGGDIEAGLAIAEMVAGMTKPTVTLVLGGGHSIGIPLAVSGQQTFIVPSASMTVHPVRMSGLMIAAPPSYRYFERVQESIVSFVARHSRITQDDFRRLMLADGDMSNDVGTILYGSQAVELGLIDRLGTLSDALEALYGMIGKNG